MQHSRIGRLVEIASRPHLTTVVGETGYVLFGPYQEYPPGRYVARFEVSIPDAFTSVTDNVCCVLDVFSAGPEPIEERTNVFISFLRAGQKEYFLPFKVTRPRVLEFRVRGTGFSPLAVSCEREVKRVEDDRFGQYSPMLPPDQTEVPAFFAGNAAHFRVLYECGARLSISDGKVIANYNGVRFSVEHHEDFQLIHEIFFRREYNVVSGRRVCAIDVGMNAGLTTLHLASLPYVDEVHSFEPFSRPFERARRNIALNDRLASKIHPNRYGLSDIDREDRVLVNPNTSISTSIKGQSVGEEELISIRDAASIFPPIFTRAEALGMDVFMKIDCEGSEFAVIDALYRHKLLRHVTALAVEWHKWWDYGKTQFDLFQPLFEEGFLVFDATPPSAPHGGMFYAVRAQR